MRAKWAGISPGRRSEPGSLLPISREQGSLLPSDAYAGNGGDAGAAVAEKAIILYIYLYK